ncbi:MAG: hypothetical protein M3478_10710 [Planctomycetota bacterium]|nr:hypothetical protein [Planctomycetota bacterium]
MNINMTVAGVGPVRGRSYCVLGRTGATILHFYAEQHDWDARAATLDKLAASFRRTPGQTVTLGRDTVTTGGTTLKKGFDWNRVGQKALGGHHRRLDRGDRLALQTRKARGVACGYAHATRVFRDGPLTSPPSPRSAWPRRP